MTDSITTTHDLQGRTLTVKVPDLAQMGLLEHQSRTMQRDGLTQKEGVRALSLTFRILFSLVPEQADLEYIQDLIADGNLDVVGFTTFVMEAANKMEDEQQEEAKPVQVRRGRPRKKVA